MKIPVELLHKIIWFVFDHYTTKGLVGSPAEVGAQCGVVAVEWLAQAGDGVAVTGYTEVSIVSWAERLGKHLAIFFISEREG